MTQLSKFELANIKRLQACTKPIDTKIARLRQKQADFLAKTNAEIAELENEISGFREIIATLLSKESVPEEIVEEATELPHPPEEVTFSDSYQEAADIFEDYTIDKGRFFQP